MRTTLFHAEILLQDWHYLLEGGMHYKRAEGSGKLNPDRDPGHYSGAGVDCSGFVRYVLARASRGTLTLPGGSDKQRSRLKQLNYREIDANRMAGESRRSDDMLRVGFRKTIPFRKDGEIVMNDKGQRKKLQVGHVWLMINGGTFQSSSRRGIGPLASDWSARRGDADEMFVLGPVPGYTDLLLGSPGLSPKIAATMLE